MVRSLFLFIILIWICYHSPAQEYPVEQNHLRIIHLSDVQLGLTYYLAQQEQNNEILADTGNLYIDHLYFKRAITEINSLNPDIIINTGDLVNDVTDTAFINDYKEMASRLKAPVFVAIGNHDGWNASEIENFRQEHDQKDYYSFRKGGCLFIILNSWYLKHPELDQDGAMKQKHFILETLAQNTDATYKIIAFHVPAYMNVPDEKEGHSSLPQDERNWLLETASKYGINLFLSGHSHQNSVLKYKETLTLITTGSIGFPFGTNVDGTPSVRGFRIIDIDLNTSELSQEFIPIHVSNLQDHDNEIVP